MIYYIVRFEHFPFTLRKVKVKAVNLQTAKNSKKSMIVINSK